MSSISTKAKAGLFWKIVDTQESDVKSDACLFTMQYFPSVWSLLFHLDFKHPSVDVSTNSAVIIFFFLQPLYFC